MRMKIPGILCTVLLVAGTAVSGPFDPEYRGTENSVYAVFNMELEAFGPLPPVPPAPPVIFETGPSNYPLAPVYPEVFNDGISAVVTLPNFIDELPLKKMRIQMEFDIPIFGQDIWIDVLGYDPAPVTWSIVGGLEPIQDIWHYVDIEIYPNPDYETIWITTPFLADPIRLIEIDTVSIPEPASLGLIGLFAGGLCLARRFFVI